jgi:hypothetical protein
MSGRKASRVPIDLPGLSARQQIFRIGNASRRDPSVDAWFDEPDALRPVALQWFDRMRECGSDVRELIHDGCPVACIEDAPFGYVNAFKNHINVGFFNGAALEDPSRLLQGSGKRMRHAKVLLDEPVNEAALRELISAAYRDLRQRLEAEGKA